MEDNSSCHGNKKDYNRSCTPQFFVDEWSRAPAQQFFVDEWSRALAIEDTSSPAVRL